MVAPKLLKYLMLILITKIGELMQVWYNTDNELVKSQISSTSTKYDAIEITKADEIKLISEDEEYDISDDEYTDSSKDKFAIYIDGDAGDATTMSAINMSSINKFNFAKVGFDKSGNIEYVSAYNLKEFLVVDKVDGDEVVGVEGTGTGGSFDAEDATIIKDGKVIALSDLKKGDVLFFHTDTTKKERFAEVYNNTVTGAIDEVYEDQITVDGNTYDFNYDSTEMNKFGNGYAASAVYINKDGKIATVDSDAAEELQAAGDVTLYFDRAGNLVYIAGDVAEVASNTQTAILTDDIEIGTSTYGSKVKAQISALLENGDEEVYDLTLEDLDTITIDGVDCDIDSSPGATDEWNPTISSGVLTLTNSAGTTKTVTLPTEGQLMKFILNDSGTVKELEFFSTAGTNGGSNTSSNTLESGDTYLAGKKLLSNTLVFDANKGYAGNTLDDIKAKDVTVTKWSDYEGTDISNVDYIYNDDNEVVAIAIRATTTTDTSYEEAVITSVLRNTDGAVIKITAYVNGAKKLIRV